MGIFSTLLLFPVMGPAKGLLFVLEQIRDRVDAETLDSTLVEQELVSLSLLYDLGEVTKENYFTRETELLARLSEIHAYKESLALVGAGQGAQEP